VRRIAGECTYVDERGAVALRLEPAAAIDENQDGTRGSNLLCSSKESGANCAGVYVEKILNGATPACMRASIAAASGC